VAGRDHPLEASEVGVLQLLAGTVTEIELGAHTYSTDNSLVQEENIRNDVFFEGHWSRLLSMKPPNTGRWKPLVSWDQTGWCSFKLSAIPTEVFKLTATNSCKWH